MRDHTVLPATHTFIHEWNKPSHPAFKHSPDSVTPDQCRIKGVLGVLQHPGPQFWGPAIGGSSKLVIGL